MSQATWQPSKRGEARDIGDEGLAGLGWLIAELGHLLYDFVPKGVHGLDDSHFVDGFSRSRTSLGTAKSAKRIRIPNSFMRHLDGKAGPEGRPLGGSSATSAQKGKGTSVETPR